MGRGAQGAPTSILRTTSRQRLCWRRGGGEGGIGGGGSSCGDGEEHACASASPHSDGRTSSESSCAAWCSWAQPKSIRLLTTEGGGGGGRGGWRGGGGDGDSGDDGEPTTRSCPVTPWEFTCGSPRSPGGFAPPRSAVAAHHRASAAPVARPWCRCDPRIQRSRSAAPAESSWASSAKPAQHRSIPSCVSAARRWWCADRRIVDRMGSARRCSNLAASLVVPADRSAPTAAACSAAMARYAKQKVFSPQARHGWPVARLSGRRWHGRSDTAADIPASSPSCRLL